MAAAGRLDQGGVAWAVGGGAHHGREPGTIGAADRVVVEIDEKAGPAEMVGGRPSRGEVTGDRLIIQNGRKGQGEAEALGVREPDLQGADGAERRPRDAPAATVGGGAKVDDRSSARRCARRRLRTQPRALRPSRPRGLGRDRDCACRRRRRCRPRLSAAGDDRRSPGPTDPRGASCRTTPRSPRSRRQGPARGLAASGFQSNRSWPSLK